MHAHASTVRNGTEWPWVTPVAMSRCLDVYHTGNRQLASLVAPARTRQHRLALFGSCALPSSTARHRFDQCVADGWLFSGQCGLQLSTVRHGLYICLAGGWWFLANVLAKQSRATWVRRMLGRQALTYQAHFACQDSSQWVRWVLFRWCTPVGFVLDFVVVASCAGCAW
jgi:hypothetical protein